MSSICTAVALEASGAAREKGEGLRNGSANNRPDETRLAQREKKTKHAFLQMNEVSRCELLNEERGQTPQRRDEYTPLRMTHCGNSANCT